MPEMGGASPPPGVPAPEDTAAPVTIYTTRWCGYCRAALTLLRNREIEHVEVDVSGNTAARRWMLQITRQRTVPQIFVGDRSIGGYTELAALDHDGRLQPLLDGLEPGMDPGVEPGLDPGLDP